MAASPPALSAARRSAATTSLTVGAGPAGAVVVAVGLVVLLVGLLVSVFQAATQLNEATLSFVPKIVALVAVLALAGPWMLQTLVEYLQRMLLGIPGVVG